LRTRREGKTGKQGRTTSSQGEREKRKGELAETEEIYFVPAWKGQKSTETNLFFSFDGNAPLGTRFSGRSEA
jgi:hypothetical protein